jgi:adenylate cyclase
VLGVHTDETFPNITDVLGHFANGIRKYRARQFQQDVDQFERALSNNPKEKLSATYLERYRYIVDHPPQQGWSGVWVRKGK